MYVCLTTDFLPLDGAKPTVYITLQLNKQPTVPVVTIHELKHILLCLPSLQGKQQQCIRSGLGQDGGAVAEGEGSRGAEESPEDDAAAVAQPHDREHTHVHRWRCHTPAG